MVFYGYTLKKQIKSVSTYITAFFALLPIWLTVVLYVKGNSNADSAEKVSSFIAFITFPVGMIFLSFKISQIFRDEIENKTLLSIQSKPITRKQLVLQGILVIITWSIILSFACGLLPFIVLAVKYGGNLFLHGILIMLTSLLLLVMIGTLGLWLSLSMSGKAFVGTMIGGFVVGFYVLFAASSIISQLASKNKKLSNVEESVKNLSITPTILPDGTITLDFAKTEDAEKIYNDLKAVDNVSIYTIYSWISPSSQFGRMFAANSKVADSKDGSKSLDPIDALIGETSTKDVEIKGNRVSFKTVQQQTPPVWFPYVLWIVIGGVTVPLMIRSISKKNIA